MSYWEDFEWHSGGEVRTEPDEPTTPSNTYGDGDGSDQTIPSKGGVLDYYDGLAFAASSASPVNSSLDFSSSSDDEVNGSTMQNLGSPVEVDAYLLPYEGVYYADPIDTVMVFREERSATAPIKPKNTVDLEGEEYFGDMKETVEKCGEFGLKLKKLKASGLVVSSRPKPPDMFRVDSENTLLSLAVPVNDNLSANNVSERSVRIGKAIAKAEKKRLFEKVAQFPRRSRGSSVDWGPNTGSSVATPAVALPMVTAAPPSTATRSRAVVSDKVDTDKARSISQPTVLSTAMLIPKPPGGTGKVPQRRRLTTPSESSSLPASLNASSETSKSLSVDTEPTPVELTEEARETKVKGPLSTPQSVLLLGPDDAAKDDDSTASVNPEGFVEVVDKNGIMTYDKYSSTTLTSIVSKLRDGLNTCVFSVHSGSRPTVHTSQIWTDSLLPPLFSELFQSLTPEVAAQTSMEVSLVLIKQDMCRDLLSASSDYAPISVAGFPLLGAHTTEGKFAHITTQTVAISLVKRGLFSLSSDDYVKGCVVSVVNVKRFVTDSAGKLSDVVLSSLVDVSSSVQFMYDVLLHRLSPKTTTLLEYSLRKSLQVYFFVHAKKLTREEEEMTMYLKHCFDTLRTMAPQPGSVAGLMRHIESTAATLREKLRGNMTDLEKKRRQWRSSSSKKEDDSDEEDDERDPKEVAAEKARLYQEYHRVKLLVKRQNLSLRSLVRIRNDCNTLFSNFNAFPPAYLSTTVHLRDQWFTDRQEAEKVPGVFAGQLMNGVSEMSDDSIANGKWDKRYFFPYRKTVPARSVFERWQPHVPPLNLFAGDFAVPRKGVTATLDTREIAKYFDPSDGSATDTIRSVVFLEEPEEDPENGVVPPPSLFVSPHNGLQVKDETYEMGEELSNSVGVEYPTDETVIRKSWSERGGKPNPKSVPSSILNESLEAFQRGSNVQLLSMTGGGPQSCSMVRLLRSPLWLALREMVANILVGQEPEPTGKGERGSPVGLFVSVVQILSADLVKDHFRTGGTDAAEGEKEEGSFTLPFKAAWTPCGPVVEGARYVKLTTVGQFWKLLRNLPPVVTTTRAEQTHLLVSFHLAQLPSSAVSPSRSQGSLETLGAAKVLYSSLSIKMTTDAALFNMLYTPEYTPPNHPKNLFNFIYCDRVVATVDLVADETGEAHFFMKALMAMKEKIRMPMHHYVWSMTNYIHCLSHYIDHLRLALCETQSTADPSIPPLYFTPVSPSKESRTPAGPLTASVSDVTEVWLQANRMLSIALHLCRNRSSAIATPMALSLHTGQVYGIVAPPSSFEKPQTEPYHDASEDSEEDVKPSESFFGPGSLFDEELSQTADGRSGRGKNTETTSERRRSSNKISVQSGTDSQPTHTNGGVSLPPVKK